MEIVQYQEYKISEEKTIKLYNTNSRTRLEEETYEEYKIRQHFNKVVEKARLKGGLWWDSRRWGSFSQAKLNEIIAEKLKPETIK